jgi:hypothetical protein
MAKKNKEETETQKTENRIEAAKPGVKSPAAPKGTVTKLPGGTVRVDY